MFNTQSNELTRNISTFAILKSLSLFLIFFFCIGYSQPKRIQFAPHNDPRKDLNHASNARYWKFCSSVTVQNYLAGSWRVECRQLDRNTNKFVPDMQGNAWKDNSKLFGGFGDVVRFEPTGIKKGFLVMDGTRTPYELSKGHSGWQGDDWYINLPEIGQLDNTEDKFLVLSTLSFENVEFTRWRGDKGNRVFYRKLKPDENGYTSVPIPANVTDIDSSKLVAPIELPSEATGTFGIVQKNGNQWVIKVSQTSSSATLDITLLNDTVYHFVTLFKADDLEVDDGFRVDGSGELVYKSEAKKNEKTIPVQLWYTKYKDSNRWQYVWHASWVPCTIKGQETETEIHAEKNFNPKKIERSILTETDVQPIQKALAGKWKMPEYDDVSIYKFAPSGNSGTGTYTSFGHDFLYRLTLQDGDWIVSLTDPDNPAAGVSENIISTLTHTSLVLSGPGILAGHYQRVSSNR